MTDSTKWLKANRCPWCKSRNRGKCVAKVTRTYEGWRCWGYRCDIEKRWTA